MADYPQTLAGAGDVYRSSSRLRTSLPMRFARLASRARPRATAASTSNTATPIAHPMTGTVTTRNKHSGLPAAPPAWAMNPPSPLSRTAGQHHQQAADPPHRSQEGLDSIVRGVLPPLSRGLLVPPEWSHGGNYPEGPASNARPPTPGAGPPGGRPAPMVSQVQQYV